ncbi:hypothetical protein STRAU_6851 [Streptomyces aurantiacus JA 4570]|uniref:Uncharacterized protein n=1 Tax=Streptomyces aurantiacus JA 4570 TaxID=1286094 RepID=S3Z8S8_9ACTN|nr:hypothetical protein STRAU_6851 [Streptomyces aurantiacus JA 4570]
MNQTNRGRLTHTTRSHTFWILKRGLRGTRSIAGI